MRSASPFPAYVIAVTGASGAGKTTLVRKTAELLGDAVTLFFDDYERTSSYPRDIARWLQEGADPEQFQTPVLAEHLRLLRSGQAVINPRTQSLTEPAAYVVMEEPFGRVRLEMRELVDFVACIDLPLEIALARRILRTANMTADAAKFHDEMKRLLRWYLTRGGREIYPTVNAMAMADCDLILDGTKDPDDLARVLVEALHKERRGT